MLISKSVKIKAAGSIKYYSDKGYKCEKREDVIDVSVKDLPSGSNVKVQCCCDYCGAEKEIAWRRYLANIGSGETYACSSKCAQEKIRKNNMVKYGVESVSQLPEVRQKAKDTMVRIYGVEHTLQSEELKGKAKDTVRDKYGVDNASKSKEVKEKRKATNRERFGADTFFGSEFGKEAVKEVISNKYKDVHFNATEAVAKKRKQTCLSRYGVESYLQTLEMDTRKRSTYQSKYGVSWITQLPEIKEAVKVNRKKTSEHNTLSKYKKCIDSSRYEIKSYNDSFFEILHRDCGNSFHVNVKLLNDRLKYNSSIEICTICKPISSFTSSYESVIYDILDKHDITYIKGNRTLLKGKELDIYIPDHNIAIEFNGLYWHSELFKAKDYHLNKTLACAEHGIQLLHVFEDDYLRKKDIIESIILNRLMKTQHKIYGRSTVIKTVGNKEANQFLDDNHIQGSCRSQYRLGLYHRNELVSLMTFGYRKTNAKKEFELIRFCNKINTSVIGASSKLFQYFIKNTSVVDSYIISYADVSMFNGGMYKALGFEFIHRSKPNYFWVVNGKREHRWMYNKQKLVDMGFDATKTEAEIMHEQGYYRIWG
jgi:hypothetical protein